MKTYYLESLGCAKNLVDSEVMAGILSRAGLEPVEEPQEADLVLVNTCAFLEASLRELDLVLTELAERKPEHPGQRIAVTGCVMNRAREEFEELFPEVDRWIGLKDFAALEGWLSLSQSPNRERTPVLAGFHRYLRVSDGCDNHCAYCTIPSIRGNLRSVPIEELVAEARLLASDPEYPVRELVVIAQDTANYGVDLYGRQALPELLEQLHAIEEYRWIRVMYLHPDHLDPAWLPLWHKLPRLLPYFEIPIQHSEDRILRSMNRQRGRQQLLEMFSDIRKAIPQAVLRTTLISGLPGESKEDFAALQNFVKQVPFLHLGVFQYSPEEGTPASALPNQVSPATAARRQDKLLSLQQEKMAPLLEAYVGQTLEVLIEDVAETDDDYQYVGRTWFQAPEIDGLTFVRGRNLELGSICRVRIEDALETDLFGQATEN